MRHIFLVFFVLVISSFAQAHHSVLAYFNMEETTEIVGVVSKVHWKNPHIRISVEVVENTGEVTEWNIELSALSSFRNRGYSSAFVQVGEKVRVYGNPAFEGRRAMSGLNMLLENGTEVVLEASEGPYYGILDNAMEYVAKIEDSEIESLAKASAESIFRVWSTAVDDPEFPMFKGNYPLTAGAAEIKSAWVADEEALESCWSKSMPYLMVTPQPIEFVRNGENIILRFEEDDAQRLIDMRGDVKNVRPSIWGYSTGAWDGDTLVVETTKINSPTFDDRGTPQSNNIHLLERFTPIENGERLEYQIRITDPITFTEPLELSRTFIWNPARTILDWDCEA